MPLKSPSLSEYQTPAERPAWSGDTVVTPNTETIRTMNAEAMGAAVSTQHVSLDSRPDSPLDGTPKTKEQPTEKLPAQVVIGQMAAKTIGLRDQALASMILSDNPRQPNLFDSEG